MFCSGCPACGNYGMGCPELIIAVDAEQRYNSGSDLTIILVKVLSLKGGN